MKPQWLATAGVVPNPLTGPGKSIHLSRSDSKTGLCGRLSSATHLTWPVSRTRFPACPPGDSGDHGPPGSYGDKAANSALRFPEASRENIQVAEQTGRCGTVFILRTGLSLALALFLVLAAEGVLDGIGYRSANATIQNPQARVAQLEEAEHWLESYYKAPDYRHFFFRLRLAQDAAGQRLASLQERKDDIFWQLVQENGPDPITQLSPAQQYRDHNPNGKHVAQAENIIRQASEKLDWIQVENASEEAKAAQAERYLTAHSQDIHAAQAARILNEAALGPKRRENQTKLDEIQDRFKELLAKGDRTDGEYRDLQEHLGKLPVYPEAEIGKQHQQLVRAARPHCRTPDRDFRPRVPRKILSPDGSGENSRGRPSPDLTPTGHPGVGSFENRLPG